MIITKAGAKTILFSDEGYILHTENDLETLKSWIEENFSESLKSGKVTEDYSTLYEDERGYYITYKQLAKEFSELSEDEQDGRSALQYINDCMQVNGGTLKRAIGA